VNHRTHHQTPRSLPLLAALRIDSRLIRVTLPQHHFILAIMVEIDQQRRTALTCLMTCKTALLALPGCRFTNVLREKIGEAYGKGSSAG